MSFSSFLRGLGVSGSRQPTNTAVDTIYLVLGIDTVFKCHLSRCGSAPHACGRLSDSFAFVGPGAAPAPAGRLLSTARRFGDQWRATNCVPRAIHALGQGGDAAFQLHVPSLAHRNPRPARAQWRSTGHGAGVSHLPGRTVPQLRLSRLQGVAPGAPPLRAEGERRGGWPMQDAAATRRT